VIYFFLRVGVAFLVGSRSLAATKYLGDSSCQCRVLGLPVVEVVPVAWMEVGSDEDSRRDEVDVSPLDGDQKGIAVQQLEQEHQGHLGPCSIELVKQDCLLEVVSVEPESFRRFPEKSWEVFPAPERLAMASISNEENNLGLLSLSWGGDESKLP